MTDLLAPALRGATPLTDPSSGALSERSKLLGVREADLVWFSAAAVGSVVWDVAGSGVRWAGSETHVSGPVRPRWPVGAVWAQGGPGISDTLDAFDVLGSWLSACRGGGALFLTLPGRRDGEAPFDGVTDRRRRWQAAEVLSVATEEGWHVLSSELRVAGAPEVVVRAVSP